MLDKDQLQEDMKELTFKEVKKFKEEVTETLKEILKAKSRKSYFAETLEDKDPEEILQIRQDIIEASNDYLEKHLPLQIAKEKHLERLIYNLISKEYITFKNKQEKILLSVNGKLHKARVILFPASDEEVQAIEEKHRNRDYSKEDQEPLPKINWPDNEELHQYG